MTGAHTLKSFLTHLRDAFILMINSGDHDFLIPFQSTQAWIRGLNYPIIDEWRPWIFEGQIAG